MNKSHSLRNIWKWIWYLHKERKRDREPFHLYLSTDGAVVSMGRAWIGQRCSNVSSPCALSLSCSLSLTSRGFFLLSFSLQIYFSSQHFACIVNIAVFVQLRPGEVFDFAADIYANLLVSVLDCHPLWTISHEQYDLLAKRSWREPHLFFRVPRKRQTEAYTGH